MTTAVAGQRLPWQTREGLLRPSKIWCPCCGEDTWCSAELARAAAEAAAAPEFVIGTATYGRLR